MKKKLRTAEERNKIVAEIGALIKGGKNVAEACKEAGVSTPTYYQWKSGLKAGAKKGAAKGKKKSPKTKKVTKTTRVLKTESTHKLPLRGTKVRRPMNSEVTAILNLGANRTLDLSGSHREVVKTLRQLGSLFA